MDKTTGRNCYDIRCKYFDKGMEQNCSYCDDNSKCFKSHIEGSPWISVKDRLPEKDNDSSIPVLVYSKIDGIVVRPYNEYHKCWDDESGDDYYCDAKEGEITHWMPIPEPPKE